MRGRFIVFSSVDCWAGACPVSPKEPAGAPVIRDRAVSCPTVRRRSTRIPASTASAATDPPKRPTRRNWYSASATSPKAPSPKASLPYQTSSPTRVNMRSASGSRPGSLAKRCTPTPKPTSGSDSHWRWKRLARSHRGSPVGTGRCIGDSEAVGLFLWGSGGV